MEIETWADGFGVWHARIALAEGDVTSAVDMRRHASAAIRSQLAERGLVPSGRVRVIYTGMASNPEGGFFENFKEA